MHVLQTIIGIFAVVGADRKPSETGAGMIAGKLKGGLCAILVAVILNRCMHPDEAADLSDRTGEET